MPNSENSNGVQNNKPVVVDNTDAETLENNNSGGQSVPSSTAADNGAVLVGTDTDWDAPITKAQLAYTKTNRGRSVKNHVTEKITKQLETAIKAVTDVTDNDGNIVKVATTDDALTFAFQHKNRDHSALRTQIKAEASRLAPFPVKVDYAKHAKSPFAHSPKAEDGDNELVYLFTVERVLYTEMPDSE